MSNIHFLPDEDPQEYEKLKAGLITEYKPLGRSEEKIISAIAKALWRVRRVQRSRLNKKLDCDTE
jgi:hypothetical protein